MKTLLYTLLSSQYDSVTSAAKAGSWVYVGKTQMKTNEILDAAKDRVMQEHRDGGVDRHGVLLESTLSQTPVGKLAIVAKVVKMTLLESRKNPTSEETAQINKLAKLGAQIKNTK